MKPRLDESAKEYLERKHRHMSARMAYWVSATLLFCAGAVAADRSLGWGEKIALLTLCLPFGLMFIFLYGGMRIEKKLGRSLTQEEEW